jgi:hypothetical protein
MSEPELQRLLKLMQMERITPSAVCDATRGHHAPKEMLTQLSFAEFTRLVEEMKSRHAREC